MHDVLYLLGSLLVTFIKDSVHREKCKQVYNLMNFHKLNNLCNQHPDQERECYQYPESPSGRLLSLPPQGPPVSWLSLPWSSSARLWTWYMCRVLQHMLLLAGFFCPVFLRFNHIVCSTAVFSSSVLSTYPQGNVLRFTSVLLWIG